VPQDDQLGGNAVRFRHCTLAVALRASASVTAKDSRRTAPWASATAAERALSLLAAEAATIVDHTDLPRFAESVWEDELVVLLAEFRPGLEQHLATRTGDVPRTLKDVVAFNLEHADVELARFGQSLFDRALAGPGPRMRPTSRRGPVA
jgi:hypothetical protein